MFSRFDFSLDDELVNEFDEKDIVDYLERLYRKAERFLRNTKTPSSVFEISECHSAEFGIVFEGFKFLKEFYGKNDL